MGPPALRREDRAQCWGLNNETWICPTPLRQAQGQLMMLAFRKHGTADSVAQATETHGACKALADPWTHLPQRMLATHMTPPATLVTAEEARVSKGTFQPWRHRSRQAIRVMQWLSMKRRHRRERGLHKALLWGQ